MMSGKRLDFDKLACEDMKFTDSHAEELGITIAPSLLGLADDVIDQDTPFLHAGAARNRPTAENRHLGQLLGHSGPDLTSLLPSQIVSLAKPLSELTGKVSPFFRIADSASGWRNRQHGSPKRPTINSHSKSGSRTIRMAG